LFFQEQGQSLQKGKNASTYTFRIFDIQVFQTLGFGVLHLCKIPKPLFVVHRHKTAKCVAALRSQLPNATIHIAQGDAQAQENYFAAAQVFNTRLQQNPLAIVYCENANHVP
jgi:hypothetical protein